MHNVESRTLASRKARPRMWSMCSSFKNSLFVFMFRVQIYSKLDFPFSYARPAVLGPVRHATIITMIIFFPFIFGRQCHRVHFQSIQLKGLTRLAWHDISHYYHYHCTIAFRAESQTEQNGYKIFHSSVNCVCRAHWQLSAKTIHLEK